MTPKMTGICAERAALRLREAKLEARRDAISPAEYDAERDELGVQIDQLVTQWGQEFERLGVPAGQATLLPA